MTSETGKNYVNHALSSALSDLKLTSELNSLDITVPDLRFGDYSTNAALVLGKKLKVNPKEVAAKIISEIRKNNNGDNFEFVEEKAGFINFKLSPKFLFKNLKNILEQKELFGASLEGDGKKVLVEYFQPNMAKPLHLGHLRTAIIGDSIFKILSSQGFKVESDTHLGDWGTQFGILIWAYKNLDGQKLIESSPNDPLTPLNKLYVEANTLVQDKKELLDKAKEEFVKLEQGDEENRKLWKQFRDWSWKEYDVVYSELGVRKSDHDWPESFYEDKMPSVINELKEKGLLVESQGAQIVNLEEYNLGIAVILKSDGGTTYLLRDLATYVYRKAQGFEKQIYVVDVRQKHTLEQTFKILGLLGHIQTAEEVIHVAYGFLTLPEGAMSTRKGSVVGAKEFIEDVKNRALEVIKEKNSVLENKEPIAKQVAAASIKYFDLSHNLKSDIVFDPKKAVSFEGNTGPYLQYTHARIRGILRKAGHKTGKSENQKITEAGMTEQESAIIRKLSRFPEVVAHVAEDLLPNILTNYLFELSQAFNAFYQEIPVIQEPDQQVKDFRLQLITATAQVIQNGLYLLGIEAPEEM